MTATIGNQARPSALEREVRSLIEMLELHPDLLRGNQELQAKLFRLKELIDLTLARKDRRAVTGQS